LSRRLELGQAQGVVAVGLAFEVPELPGIAGGVGDLAGLDDDGGAGPGEQLAEVFAAGGQGLEACGGGVASAAAGDGLVFAEVDGQNEASRGGDRDDRGGGGRGGRGCKLRGG
jgi:hypothetical protein